MTAVRKQNRGFSVGPVNLPDGTHRRKVQKIKKELINKAKIKKQYAKLKAHEDATEPTPRKSVYDGERGAGNDDEPSAPAPEPSLEPHPDRLRMLEQGDAEDGPKQLQQLVERRQRRPRSQPFQKETQLAQNRKAEVEVRQQARAAADQERARKLAEREHFRKTMARARGGPNGPRKLGRESTVLLAKAQRLMGKM